MKKKLLALALSTAMLLSACASGTAQSSAESTVAETTVAAESSKEETTQEQMDPDKVFKIGLVTDVGGVNDGSFNQSAWAGLQKSNEELGVQVEYLQSATDSDYVPNIETFIDEEYDLIISVGYMLASATREAALAHPEQKFAIVDDSTNADLPNVTCLMFKQEQASYLVGYVAGLTTKSNTVGFVLGMENETMNLFGYGYLAGAIDANPEIKVLQTNANSFADPAIGKTIGNANITNGADVVFHAAGATGLGVIEAAKEAGIYAIGVDSDQSPLAPETVLTSAMKRVDNAVFDVTKAVVEGKYTNGILLYDLAKGGVDLSSSTSLIDPEILTKVEEVKEKIVKGEIVVPASKDEFEAKYGDVYELDK